MRPNTPPGLWLLAEPMIGHELGEDVSKVVEEKFVRGDSALVFIDAVMVRAERVAVADAVGWSDKRNALLCRLLGVAVPEEAEECVDARILTVCHDEVG